MILPANLPHLFVSEDFESEPSINLSETAEMGIINYAGSGGGIEDFEYIYLTNLGKK